MKMNMRRRVPRQVAAQSTRLDWVLSGRVASRGPDNEPLLSPAVHLAVLTDQVLEEARARYESEFDVGRDSTS